MQLEGITGCRSVHVKIKEGQWASRFDIVTATDLPDSGWGWIHTLGALIKNDSNGNNHILFKIEWKNRDKRNNNGLPM